MKIERFMVLDFNKPPKEEFKVEVPTGSKFLKFTVFPDGIYGWWEVSELAVGSWEYPTFVVINQNTSIPNGFEYVDSPVMFTEEGAVIFHFYKKN